MRRAIFFISIDGQDVTSNFESHLIRLQIKLTDGGESDTVDITLDDSYGQLKFPREDADIVAMLSWSDGSGAVTFHGKTDEPESVGSRGEGMILNITARATDMKGKAKEKQEAHKDDATFEDAAKEWGKKAGLQVKVSGKLAQKKRDYWAMHNENFMSWGSRMAEELGATFKIMGEKAIFVPRNSNDSAGGIAMGIVNATYGDNIINWRIVPLTSRPRFNRSVVRWYDRKEAKWMRETVEISDQTARTPLVETKKFADKDRANDRAESNAEEAKRGKGGGQVTIDGNPNAQAQALCMVSGVRPGIDGMYRITMATHNFSRESGWTTTCDLEQPQGDAGSDSRGAAGQ